MKLTKDCFVCGNSFFFYPYRLKLNPRFCSSKCRLINLAEAQKKRETVYCQICKKEFWQNPSRKRFTCSRHCSGMLQGKFKKGQVPWNKGIPMSEKQKEVLRKGKILLFGKNNPAWKADGVGYNALHSWVVRHRGKAKKCNACGSISKIEWANKSHEYKRDLNDWIQLCSKCHKNYDRDFKGAKERFLNRLLFK